MEAGERDENEEASENSREEVVRMGTQDSLARSKDNSSVKGDRKRSF